MNKRQKNVIDLATKGGKDPELFLLDKIHTVEDDLNTHKEEMAKEMQALETEVDTKIESVKKEIPNLDKFLENVRGTQGIQGEKGDTGESPTEDALLELIMPLIPPPIKGDKGDKGDSIQGEKGDKGEPGIGIKGEDGSPDTPDQIADKLNTLEERVEMKVIKGLLEELKRIESIKSVARAGGTPSQKTYTVDISSQVNGVLTTFTIPTNFGVTGVFSTQDPKIFRPTIDYTVGNKTITLTSQVGPIQTGQTLIVQYTR